MGIRAGIGISTYLGQNSWWKSLAHVILRLVWGESEAIKFEKDLGSFFMMFFALRAKNIECHQHVVIQKFHVRDGWKVVYGENGQ